MLKNQRFFSKNCERYYPTDSLETLRRSCDRRRERDITVHVVGECVRERFMPPAGVHLLLIGHDVPSFENAQHERPHLISVADIKCYDCVGDHDHSFIYVEYGLGETKFPARTRHHTPLRRTMLLCAQRVESPAKNPFHVLTHSMCCNARAHIDWQTMSVFGEQNYAQSSVSADKKATSLCSDQRCFATTNASTRQLRGLEGYPAIFNIGFTVCRRL